MPFIIILFFNFKSFANEICTSLKCFKAMNDTLCYSFIGHGASDGTICGSGAVSYKNILINFKVEFIIYSQTCQQGVCVLDSNAPTGSCLYGDDMVTSAMLTYTGKKKKNLQTI